MALLDNLGGIGVSAATGNYLGAGVQLAGLATSVFGGMAAASKAKDAYNVQSQISGLENQGNDVREQAMHLSARRQQMEILRTSQRARAQAVQAATSQGASFGSGLQGGLAQVSGQSSFNLAGVNQNLELGADMFGINRQISSKKLELSKIQGDMATDQGISALGGSIMKSGDPLSRLLQGTGFSFGSTRETIGLDGRNAIS